MIAVARREAHSRKQANQATPTARQLLQQTKGHFPASHDQVYPIIQNKNISTGHCWQCETIIWSHNSTCIIKPKITKAVGQINDKLSYFQLKNFNMKLRSTQQRDWLFTITINASYAVQNRFMIISYDSKVLHLESKLNTTRIIIIFSRRGTVPHQLLNIPTHHRSVTWLPPPCYFLTSIP